MSKNTYTVIANNGREYSHTSAASVAGVAHAWAKQGMTISSLGAITEGEPPYAVRTTDVRMGSTIKETAAALVASVRA